MSKREHNASPLILIVKYFLLSRGGRQVMAKKNVKDVELKGKKYL